VVNRHRKPDWILLVEAFVRHHVVDIPLLEVVNNADLHCMEEVGLREVAHNAGNMSKYVQTSANMSPRVFGMGCLGVSIAGRCIYVVILPGVLLVQMHIICMFVLWTLSPDTVMPYEMI
jgi:hypothetical protein